MDINKHIKKTTQGNIYQPILTQKPSKNSKAKELLQCLEQRLPIWKEGLIEDLLQERRTIQKLLARFRLHIALWSNQ